MSWLDRTFATSRIGDPLKDQINALLKAQRHQWKEYGTAVEALDHMRSRHFVTNDGFVVAKVNPGRSRSIYAKVDATSISERPCFLCEENLPPLEQGILLGEYVVCPNPFPIHSRHLTIPLREHKPQNISGRFDAMLMLARSCGSGMVVFYNGPSCGASAPDHFHFQACDLHGLPLIEHVIGSSDTSKDVTPLNLLGRRMILFQGSDTGLIVDRLQKSIDHLGSNMHSEPMINVVAWYYEGLTNVILMPREKHRPSCFFAEGNKRMPISPAALEMSGLIMLAEDLYLDRLTETAIWSIFEEVSCSVDCLKELMEAII